MHSIIVPHNGLQQNSHNQWYHCTDGTAVRFTGSCDQSVDHVILNYKNNKRSNRATVFPRQCSYCILLMAICS